MRVGGWLLTGLVSLGIFSCRAASIDFAVSANLVAPYTGFAVDQQGDILIAAIPSSCNLPTVSPLSTCGPIWIGKLDPSGKRLLFATYLGSGVSSSVFTTIGGIGADSSGNVIVAAATNAANLPTANAFQSAPGSPASHLYIAKFASDGSHLLYATYLGGSGGETVISLAVDPAGAAYVAAYTTSTDFPSTTQSLRAPAQYPTVIAKLGPTGSLQYAAQFPFEFYSNVKPMQIDPAGRAVLVSNLEALILAPDGSSAIRATYPSFATATSPCTIDASGGQSCPEAPWALPLASGGFEFAGTANLGVPATANARQIAGESNGHFLLQNGQVTATSLTASINDIEIDPENPGRIYAAAATGLFVSADNGNTWNQVYTGPSLAVAVDPFDSNRIFLSVDTVPGIPAQIYRSTDGGATWKPVYNSTQSGEHIISLAADPKVPGLIYGAGPLMYRSTDGGNTWDSREVGPSMPNISPSASTSTKSQFVRVDPNHAGWAYVVGINNCIGFCPNLPELSRTQDGGNTWTDGGSAQFNAISHPMLVAVDPNNGSVVQTLSGSTLIYPSGNISSSQVLYPAEATAVAFDPRQPGTIYLAVNITKGAASGYFVVKSSDDGSTWTNLLQVDRPVFNLVVSANGVVQASQDPDPPQLYYLVSNSVGDIEYGTFFGGAFTQISAMAGSFPGSGSNAYIVGVTQGGLPLTDAVQPALGGGTDGFLTAFDAGGSLLWSTYLGGSGNDSIDWVLPLADGSVVVAGTTQSTDFPSLQPSPLGAGSTFIAHLRP